MAKIKLHDVKRAVDAAKEAMPLIEPIVRKHGPEIANQAGRIAHQAGSAVGGAKKSIAAKIQQRKDGKKQKRALDESRRKAVASSLPPIPADEFFKNFEANVSDAADLGNGYLAICGCYAILTLKSSREKDLSAYKDVYVDCSKSVGLSVYSHFRGLGNVDVYADFKFKEPMRVLIYPCEEGEMPKLCAELAESLQAFDSYNKRDLESSGDWE
ncbi:MAG: hypothetical protein U0L71_06760 [Eggerthellaceae bacterium]|nr:hypothetical protein [Eggerthellaceae bacterium]